MWHEIQGGFVCEVNRGSIGKRNAEQTRTYVYTVRVQLELYAEEGLRYNRM